MPQAIDVTGEKYGRLTAIRRTSRPPMGSAVWEFRCDCGKTHYCPVGRVRSGNTKSCGCWNIEQATARVKTHGKANTPEWEVWKTMKQRCHNPKCKRYPGWGGRGIVVCQRWRDSFESFIADVGIRPSPKHTIERINNDGNYEPGNVKWATMKEQRHNRRDSNRAAA